MQYPKPVDAETFVCARIYCHHAFSITHILVGRSRLAENTLMSIRGGLIAYLIARRVRRSSPLLLPAQAFPSSPNQFCPFLHRPGSR